MSEPVVTPDERYLVARGRLWRRSDPGLSEGRHGERCSVWRSDSMPDLIRRLARNTRYADWYETVGKAE